MPLRAVLFDLDGTLYHQRPVRAWMAAELGRFVATDPRRGWRTAQVLRAYRRAQESLRHSSPALYEAATQLDLAASRSGVPRQDVARIVDEWMFERPLKYLARYKASGLADVLRGLEQRGLRLGVLSDYEATRKLRALGIERCFSQVLCAADADVRALKPSPRGFLVACERWQLLPEQVVMVGDRADADAAGATAAGMRSVIVGRRALGAGGGATFVSSLEQVSSVIDECC
ncbi:MAG: HAD family hydrolase [Vicinamibacterales bacterium]